MTYSIAQCRQAIEHLIAMYADAPNNALIDASRQGCTILAWLEKRQELVKAVERLDRARPDLVDILKAFPGAEIADVRSMFPGFNNGSGVHDAE